MAQQFILATGNQGKVKELATTLAPYDTELLPQSDFNVSSVAETGLTFVENAIIKARHAAKESGLPALADDSGLAVDALGGAPGIYSSRFAGEDANDQDNIDKLLASLDSVDTENRGAQFHCCLVFVRHWQDPTPLICDGVWRGQILEQPSGNGGFGYDPVFWLPEQNKTAAQLSKVEKQAISHRGQAVQQMIDLMLARGIINKAAH